MRPHRRLLLAPLSVFLASCFSEAPPAPPPVAPQTATVQGSATANVFSPATVTVARGGTVTWTFGARPHNVSFLATTGAPSNIPTTTNNQVSREFTAAGTFAYACTLHPGMFGTVTVQ
jgi:plastocyanin